jgi:hypothetical protein
LDTPTIRSITASSERTMAKVQTSVIFLYVLTTKIVARDGSFQTRILIFC